MRNNNHTGSIQIEQEAGYVFDDGGPIYFKPGLRFKELEPGRYYPYDDGNKFILQKVMKGVSGEVIGISDKLKSSFILKSEMDDFRMLNQYAKELDDGKTRENESDYFPMEKYHPTLLNLRKAINLFIEKKHHYYCKRGILVAGAHGVSKTFTINKIVDELILSHNAVCLKIDTMDHLNSLTQFGMLPIAKYLEDRLKIIHIEEMAELSDITNDKTLFLTLLDSKLLSTNTLFLITTNHPEKVPANIIDRPSRIDEIFIIKSTDFDENYIADWYEFIFNEPFPEQEKNAEWFKKVYREFSPAYVKELFNQVQIYEISPREAWLKLKKRRELICNNFNDNDIGFG